MLSKATTICEVLNYITVEMFMHFLSVVESVNVSLIVVKLVALIVEALIT